MTEKKTQTKKPPAKSPADNAGSGVGGPPGVARDPFNLPALPNYTAELASVYWQSGLFGDLTPATIAILILAGRSLGLDDAAAVFDLKITPAAGDEPARIDYQPAMSYQKAGDDIQATKAYSRAIFENAIKDGKPITFAKGEPVKIGGEVLEFPESANKSPSPFDEPAAALSVAPTPETASAAAQDASAAANDGNQETGGEFRTEFERDRLEQTGDDLAAAGRNVADLGDAGKFDVTETVNHLNEQIEQAKAAEAVGDASPETIALWRNGIRLLLEETGRPDDKIAETLQRFDDRSLPEKRKMFDDAQVYYKNKIANVRDAVLERLRADGKQTIDEMIGFFTFAELPSNPDVWSYNQAVRAAAQLELFMNPPKPAA